MRSPSSAKNLEISGSCVTHNHTPRDLNTRSPVFPLDKAPANQPAKDIQPEMGLPLFDASTENRMSEKTNLSEDFNSREGTKTYCDIYRKILFLICDTNAGVRLPTVCFLIS